MPVWGEGNGNPLQYSCLENPMDGGAWWGAVHGVAKSRDLTERLHFHFSLSCIGEGNGNPLQCSCLENPRDGGIWWAAICGVAQSQTRLKWLSSSSSMPLWGREGVAGIHLLLFSHSVVSGSLWPHRLQYTKLPVFHYLLEFAQTHVHWVDDAIQPSPPLSPPSPAFSLSL